MSSNKSRGTDEFSHKHIASATLSMSWAGLTSRGAASEGGGFALLALGAPAAKSRAPLDPALNQADQCRKQIKTKRKEQQHVENKCEWVKSQLCFCLFVCVILHGSRHNGSRFIGRGVQAFMHETYYHLGLPVVPFYCFFFGGGFQFPYKNRLQKKLVALF